MPNDVIGAVSILIPLLTALAFVGACVVVGLRVWKNPDFFITIETEEPRDRKGE